jgi:hypothetical protein
VQALAPFGAMPEARAKLDNAQRWLLERQRSDGSFPASARLRVPPPAALDPVDAPGTLTYLDRDRIFTTATVIAALAALDHSGDRPGSLR